MNLFVLNAGTAAVAELSVKDMFMDADPVVKAVMILLLLASLVSWLIILEKAFVLGKVRHEVGQFKKLATKLTEGAPVIKFPDFAETMVEAGRVESLDSSGRETRSDFRERVERSMRLVLSGQLELVGSRTAFLATVGASSPFIGLFGTVWGIMHSFVGIAAAGETSLAVVAPGIAEALLATAMGLVAAIPAVIAYNKITASMKKLTKEAMAGISLTGNYLSKNHFTAMEEC